jgi:beta-lactamase class A
MKSPRRFWAIRILVAAVGFGGGWIVHGALPTTVHPPLPLRFTRGDYQYVSPLLACNSGSAYPQSMSVTNAIQSVITAHQQAGDVSAASVYFTNFSTGNWASVNGSQKYYPSSLGKVPIMMALYELSEESKISLDQQVLYPPGSKDLNATQEIQPAQAIVPGKSYSIHDLIQYMIEGSDNNAAQLLFSLVNQNDLGNIYSDLQIPVNNNVTPSTLDFMTPQQYAILFRTLYNTTYLTRKDSEDILSLMTQTSFMQGIVAGLPSSTTVAHKFGIVSIYNGTEVTSRELHDCGIVYAPNNSYLLCVMTRGSSNLGSQEQTVSDISHAVYQTLEATHS